MAISNPTINVACNADGTGPVIFASAQCTEAVYEARLFQEVAGNTVLIQTRTNVPSGATCYFPALGAGEYFIAFFDATSPFRAGRAPAGPGYLTVTLCSFGCSLLTLVNAATYRQDWRTTGNLTLDVGSAVPVNGARLMPGNIAGVVAGTTVVFASLPAGRYSFALLAGGNACILFGTAALVLGCTDPLSLNYNPLATDNDPSAPCAPYPDPARVFALPACQSLTFAPGQITTCGTYPDPARVLFNDAARNRQESDYFAQRLTICDVVKVQIWSNYPSARVVLTSAGGADTIFPAVSARAYRSLTATEPVAFLTATLDPTLSRITGPWPTLPAWAVVGAVVTIGAGPFYRIAEINPWSREVFLRMSTADGPPQAVSLSIGYDAATYDVWEAIIDFTSLPAGCYSVRAEALDGFLSAVAATWYGEPVELGAEWPDCHLLDWTNHDRAFGIDYATGITHRRRVPAILHELGAGGKQETTRDGAYALVTLGGYVTDTAKWQTTWVPPYLSRVLARAFAHDAVWVDGVRMRTEERYRIVPQKGYALETGDIVLERAVGVDVNRTDAGAELTAPTGGLEYNSAEYN